MTNGERLQEGVYSADGQTVKQCCSRLYESDLAKLLLGDSFHPGGLDLTRRLGQILQLTPESRVLDVASGRGTSAVFLAEHFGCQVLGLDYGGENVQRATELAATSGLSGRVRFERADAESLPVENAAFDAIICECAFCTFTDKSAVAREFSRALRSGGRAGIGDVTRVPALTEDLNGLLAHLACIADAQPIEGYTACLLGAGFSITDVEKHDDALREMVKQVKRKLFGAEILVGLRKLDLPGVDLPVAKQMAQITYEAVERGHLGYALISAVKL